MPLAPAPDPRAVPLQVIAPAELDGWLERQDAATRAWVRAGGLRGRRRRGAVPAGAGRRARRRRWSAGARRARRRDRFALAAAAAKLPAGAYALRAGRGRRSTPASRRSAGCWPTTASTATAPAKPRGAVLVCPEGVDAARLERIAARGGAGAGPDQHAGARHGAGGAGGGLRRARRPARRRGAGDPRRGGAQGGEPADDRGGRRRRRRAAAAARPRLGPGGRAEGDAGRQGRLLRHRRARHQAGEPRWG